MVERDSNVSKIQKRLTLKDIARELDLSHATVSRALSGKADPLISEATRERVCRTALELGYRPNGAARSLATGRTGLIALWLWSEGMQDSYHAAVSQRFHSEAMRHSYQLVVDLVGWPATKSPPRNTFDSWNVDGVIAHEAGPAISSQFKHGMQPPVPVVSTGAYHLLEDVDQVQLDLSDGAREAMQHLLSSGRKRIAYLTDKLAERGPDPRYLAYTHAIEGAGLRTEYIETGESRADARRRIKAYFADFGMPEAIFCHHDDFAIAVYRGLCDLGLRVPDDVALVGCNGIEDCEYLEVPLTTIAQPFDQLCSLATLFLDQRIEDPTRPVQTALLKAELIIRESSGGRTKRASPPDPHEHPPTKR